MTIIVPVMVFIIIYLSIFFFLKPEGEIDDAISSRTDSLVKTKKLLFSSELDVPFLKRIFSVFRDKISPITNRLSFLKKMDSSASGKKLATQLYSAGVSITPQEFTAIKTLSIVTGALITTIISSIFIKDDTDKLLCIFCGVLLPYTVFRYGLAFKITLRRSSIDKQLPDVIDLLGVAIEAGMGFDQALGYITENTRGPLVDEIAVTVREMSLGKSKKQAFTALVERTNVESVQTFSNAIIQSIEMGISMKTILDAQSLALRTERMNRAKEKAAKVSVKMLIPMLLFIFPVLFIILLGPAIISAMTGSSM